MSKKLQPVRGTHDLLTADCLHYRHIVDTARRVSGCYGFAEAMTPVFEFSEVFHRTLGETSDVVSKETYTFTDRGGESITLRPEFTASIARAFISNGLQDQLPCKFFYSGPAFRYERPQKGRLRQFHQIGVELLGVEQVQADIEIIALGQQLFAALGLETLVTLELNSLGDTQSREDYRKALVTYLSDHRTALSEDSQLRLEKNPLRILDSKSEGDQSIIANAPLMHDYFNDASRTFFDTLQSGLSQLGIAYTVNPKLVRGLDYYCHTVFEFTTAALGSQNAVLAGGRYDGLIGMMGGQHTPGIGFASGIERIMALREEAAKLTAPASIRPIALIPLGDAAEKEMLQIAYRLRGAGYVVDQSYNGNMSKRMKKADKMNAIAALILGDDELKNGQITLRDFATGTQTTIALASLDTELISYKDRL
ncbi:MAG: histidine--tRNA ligase [Rickettsiales bacterium]